MTGEDEVDAFERHVLGQEPVEPGRYDADYFAAGWREDASRYDLETRRRIEDRHPALIKAAFAPRRVLDAGCGPGFLLLFLAELGVEAEGVDFAEVARELAPDGVADRILHGELTDLPVPDGAYDLVICREAIEHLTAVQARRAVSELCRASSRFVYVTTRFHPEPAPLLALTTDLDTDPTHITLMTKRLLRVLFVLEGFRARTDLEARLDWAGKGRVLVYERALGSSR